MEVVEEESESLSNPYKDLIVTDAEKSCWRVWHIVRPATNVLKDKLPWYKWRLIVICTMLFLAASVSLLAPNQFAVGNYYNPEQMEAVEAALSGDPALDLNTDVVFFSTGALTYGSYYKTIEDHVFRTYT